ncbi:MAG: 8-oxo-dGTP diphosphatase [Desulfofustis sp. PB-SRB1]|jgi:8-oxo-dGTP diphosphatase|nr:8-oxo-dGTP diphosphatase [Desulfofustis sp. PB-SRB1]MBM1001403.1 8-oxo-dGTP diphosphatase [Desulfofustis sp. PB-SRB1]HBH28087.1 NUDIX domain-containing protein [Desulfofustis sp.]HBH31179.1 NUDIX domain-containing protein [Desulfofustis sp.]
MNTYTPILATLGFVMSADQSSTLLVHRNRRTMDVHYGKFNGLGGKVLAEESIYECICREINEEAGITCEQVVLRGTINWQGFGGDGEDWFGFIFRIDGYRGTPFTKNDDGELIWHPVTQLHTLPMWEGDKQFLPMVFDADPRVFHGVMPYRGEQPLSWRCARL